jgi:hypothetical protein
VALALCAIEAAFFASLFALRLYASVVIAGHRLFGEADIAGAGCIGWGTSTVIVDLSVTVCIDDDTQMTRRMDRRTSLFFAIGLCGVAEVAVFLFSGTFFALLTEFAFVEVEESCVRQDLAFTATPTAFRGTALEAFATKADRIWIALEDGALGACRAFAEGMGCTAAISKPFIDLAIAIVVESVTDLGTRLFLSVAGRPRLAILDAKTLACMARPTVGEDTLADLFGFPVVAAFFFCAHGSTTDAGFALVLKAGLAL